MWSWESVLFICTTHDCAFCPCLLKREVPRSLGEAPTPHDMERLCLKGRFDFGYIPNELDYIVGSVYT